MDINTIIQAVGAVGFPIVACCCMFYLYNETITKIVNTLDKLTVAIENLDKKIGEK